MGLHIPLALRVYFVMEPTGCMAVGVGLPPSDRYSHVIDAYRVMCYHSTEDAKVIWQPH